MERKPHDKPKDEIIALLDRVAAAGANGYIKWTCEKCGQRCMSAVPNVFNEGGYLHDEPHCGHMSHPTKYGMMLSGPTDAVAKVLATARAGVPVPGRN
jgi:hypothetical protein